MPRRVRLLLLSVVIAASSGISPLIVAATHAPQHGSASDCPQCPGGGEEGGCPPNCALCTCGSHVVPTAPTVPVLALDLASGEASFTLVSPIPPSAPPRAIFHPPRPVA